MARRLGEGEAELGHQLHCQPRPHRREPAAAPAHLELLRTDPRLPTLFPDERRHLAEPDPPGPLALEAYFAFCQQPLDEGPGAEDAGIGHGRLRPAADGLDLGPAPE